MDALPNPIALRPPRPMLAIFHPPTFTLRVFDGALRVEVTAQEGTSSARRLRQEPPPCR